MTTRSLILSPHEIRAALDGRLGLVVRPVMPQPTTTLMGHEGEIWHRVGEGKYQSGLPDKCPLGVPGDRLCCKEAWAHDALSYPHFQKSMTEVPKGKIGMFGPHFHADAGPDGFNERGNWLGGMEWRSPATMPAWASRITLEVESVRVCRAFDLTGKDAIACGFVVTSRDEAGAVDLARTFKESWDSKYARRGLGWNENPWVWETSVKRVTA